MTGAIVVRWACLGVAVMALLQGDWVISAAGFIGVLVWSVLDNDPPPGLPTVTAEEQLRTAELDRQISEHFQEIQRLRAERDLT